MIRTRLSSVATTLVLLAIGFPSQAADVIVVCPDDFTVAMQPWLVHRRSEGLDVRMIPSGPDANSVRTSIAEAANDQTRYVLLIGDAPVIGTPCNVRLETPILYAPTKVTAAWGSTATMSSDMLFGDFDGDMVPDAVVGRMPVDNPKQLEKWIARILAREASVDFGPWRSQVQLVGGIGGFGKMADAAIESVTRTIVTSVLPIATKTSVCYASPGHLFCPADKSFTDAVLDRYQQGARFWVYAGHGQVTHLDRVPAGATGTPVLDQQSVKRLSRPASGSPIAVMLSCYTGALDAAEDSIAEEMVLCEGGPIAVVAGSRMTMPYGNTTAAVGLIHGVFQEKLPRLGDAWMHALNEMQEEVSEDTSASRMMIDALAMLISPAGTVLADERREHMLLYNLIGDPTLRLNHPQEMEMDLAAGYDLGEAIKVEVKSPIDGELTVSFDRPLGGVRDGDPNDTTVASISFSVDADQTAFPTVLLPKDVRGPIIVRAFVAGETAWATAAAKTIVR